MRIGTRTRWRAAALAGPFVLVFAGLFVGGGAAGRLFTSLYAGKGYAWQTQRGFEVSAPKGSEHAGYYAAINLDEFMKRLAGAYPTWRLARPPKLNLWLWLSQADFENFGERRTGARFERNSGYFDPDRNDLAVILGPSQDASIRHEATHALFHDHAPPRWLGEGLATYFENSTAERLGGGDPGAQDAALQALKTGQLSLKDLFEARPDAFYGPGNQAYYDVANQVVTYFLDGDGHGLRQKFVDFVAGAREGDSPRDVERVLGMPAAEFQVKLIETLAAKDPGHGR